MFPLSFHRWGAVFVRIWGYIFFGMSFLVFQLSYLPLLEFILWISVTHSRSQVFENIESVNTSDWMKLVKKAYLSSMILFCVFCVSVLFFLMKGQKAEFGKIKSRSSADFPVPLKALDFYLKLWGLYPPNVFNTPDVESGKQWATLVRVLDDGSEQLVPFVGHSGERLAYHRSDLVYYRNSLPLRRCLRNQEPDCERFLRELAYFDRFRNKSLNISNYKVYRYSHEASVSVSEMNSVAPEVQSVELLSESPESTGR